MNIQEIGLLYPEPYKDIPYWKYTWLSNTGKVKSLLYRSGSLSSIFPYVDFPAGFMFWARLSGIAPLLKASLTYHDFAEETDQSDGTLVHAIERSLVPLARSRGMTFCEVDFKKKTYRLNNGSENLWQYWNKDIDGLRSIIDLYDTISFDIFDTLVTRPLLFPDSTFEIVEIKAHGALHQNIEFLRHRKQAEYILRKRSNFGGDCSLDDIYWEFQKITGLSESICESIKQLEVQTEIDLCIPRHDMVDIFDYAKTRNKRIVLITDMYLRRHDLEGILSKCGLSGYDEILLSSEIRKRKDTGELWDDYKDSIVNSTCLHIGDNEYSDVYLPAEKGLDTFHVMSCRSMFYNTGFGKRLLERFDVSMQCGDSAILGTLITKEFNSPFALHRSEGKYRINDLRSMGYVVFGPIFITFIAWLTKSIQDDNRDVLLFLSREGYFLEKLYHKLIDCLEQNNVPVKKPDTRYFLASRRAASIASIMDENDIMELLEIPYNGTLSYLLNSRFGINHNDMSLPDETIILPRDVEKVKEIILFHKAQILHSAKKERDDYLQYCHDIDLFAYGNIAIIDLGYSGSMQYYLSKIFQRPTIGYYLVTSDTLRGLRYKGNIMRESFGYKDEDTRMVNPMYTYALILEAILTSPDGQFMGFHREHDMLKPIFNEPGNSQKIFQSLNSIYEGIIEFIEDVTRVHGSYLLDLPMTKNISQFILKHIVLDNDLISQEIQNLFYVDDKYGSDKDISIFDFYRKMYGME